MNIFKAYQICHELMLLSPNYVPSEGATVTYLITQIADTEEAVHIQSTLINPALPGGGNLRAFLERSLDQQIAIMGLASASFAFKTAHQNLQAALSKKISNEESVQRLRQLLSHGETHEV